MAEEFCRIELKRKDVQANALKKMYNKLALHYVSVGVHRKEGQEVINIVDGKPYTMIKNACVQEFGATRTIKKSIRFKSPYTGKWFYIKKGTTIRIPARIFIRIFSQNKQLQKELTQTFKESIETYKFAHPIYENVGEYAKLKMKSRIIAKQVKPKNAPMTVEYKGFNHPLVLTGKLMGAITSEVH